MFDPKDSAEEITLTFDFSARGSAVSNPTFDVRMVRGIDSNPSAILSGSPTVSGAKVLQRTIGGNSHCWYLIRCFVDINGDRVVLQEILPIQDLCTG